MAGPFSTLASKAQELDLLSVRGISLLIATLIGLQVAHATILAIYNLYFHPLRHFPGPKLWIAFGVTKTLGRMQGTMDLALRDLHDKYGDVVRISADELSFIHPDAWKDIYGHGHAELPKWYPPGVQMDEKKIIATKGNNHFRMRRAMLPAFSDRALGQQEQLIKVYVDLLMQRLGEVAESGESTNMVRWYNLTTFDMIADLAYGEPLHGLSSGNSNRWISNIEAMMKLMPALVLIGSSPLLAAIFQFLLGSKIRNSKKNHEEYATQLAVRRINRKEQADRGDFMDFLMRSRGQKHELTDDELVANCDLLMVAGSETTATLLTGATFWLVNTPEAYKKATEEVRSAFKSVDEITFKEASAKLPYMLACLNEALRIFPSIPIILGRQTLPNVITPIAGHNIPPMTRVGVHHLSAYHSAQNFKDARSFHPERWLPESTNDPSSPYYNDRREAHKPFSFGPRDCIGRNLAYHEMRLILARLLWEFDLELDEGMANWHNQKIHALWEKPPLMLKLKRRRDL